MGAGGYAWSRDEGGYYEQSGTVGMVGTVGIVDMMGIVGMVGMMGIVGMPNRGSEASWVILTPGVSILARGHQWLHTRTSMVSFWTIWLLQVPQRMLLGRWGIGVEWGRVLSQYANINAMVH